MSRLDPQAFARAIWILADLHGKDWRQETIQAFYEDVADLPGDLVLEALRLLRTESEFMPKPAEVRQRVAELRRNQRAIEAEKAKALAPAPDGAE
jgi:hypothetical protein